MFATNFIPVESLTLKNSGIFRCDNCDDLTKDTLTLVYDNGDESYWCNYCVNHDSFECENCNDNCANDSESIIENVCTTCYNDYACTCKHCEAIGLENDFTQIDDYYVCDECLSEKYSICDTCGERFYNENDNSIFDDESYFCDNECYETCIKKTYNSKYMQINIEGREKSFLMGIEFECALSYGNALSFIDSITDFHISWDGSINQALEYLIPCELIGAPLLIDENKNLFKQLFENYSNDFNSEYDDLYHFCGVHIHLNRGAIILLQLGKALVFMNSDENADFISHVSNRDIQICQYAESCDKKISDAKKYSTCKYEILNTCKQTTIEFRCFAGTNELKELYSYMEFVHALMHHLKLCSMTELGYVDFIKYVRQHKKNYPNLFAKIGNC